MIPSPSRRNADACILHARDVSANYNVMGTSGATDKCTKMLNSRWGSRRYISSLDSKPAIWNSLVPKNNFAADFRAEKSQEVLRRKTNDLRSPVNLGQRILKIVVFGARRRLLHPHFGLGSNENV